MSFDIYLQCVAGDPPGISRAAVRALFPIVEKSSEPDYWSVYYDPANSCKIGITPTEHSRELITLLCVNRPCGVLPFWEAVLGVLKLGPMILFWPGGGPLAASEFVAAGLAPEMVESLGRPKCVRSAQEIIDAIRES